MLVSTLAAYLEAIGADMEIFVRMGHDVFELRLEESRGTKRPRKSKEVLDPLAKASPPITNLEEPTC